MVPDVMNEVRRPRHSSWPVIVAGLVFLVFLVASHLAWLNPRPGFEVYRTFDSWPFMWQYNADAGMEIISAAYFPHGFETYPQRINRPLYPALAWAIGNAGGLVLSPLRATSPLERAAAGYIVLKLVVQWLGVVVSARLLERYMSRTAARVASLFMLLHPFVFAHIATFHTTELQVWVPVFSLWMVFWTAEETGQRYWRRVLLSAAVIGVLMLGKQNFAVAAALAVWLLGARRWREVLAAVPAFLAPLLLYMAFLRLVGLSYRNNEIAAMEQGIWVLRLLQENPYQLWVTLHESIYRFFEHMIRFYGIGFLLAAIALGRPERRVGTGEPWFVFLLSGATWAQYAAVRRLDVVYMVGDVWFVVLALAVWLVWDVWRLGAWRRWFSPVVLAFYGLASVLTFLNLPWVHPMDQAFRSPEVLESRLEMVENPDAP